MTATKKGRHLKGRGGDPHRNFTSLPAGTSKQNRVYSQDVREDSSWVRKPKKEQRANRDKYRDNKSSSFTKLPVTNTIDAGDRYGKAIQPGRLVAKDPVTIKKIYKKIMTKRGQVTAIQRAVTESLMN